MAKESTKKQATGANKAGLPCPRDYSLRVFYGPGYNLAIDQALFKIVGRQSDSSGCFLHSRQERDLEWHFGTERSAVAAANRIINRVDVPGGKLLCHLHSPDPEDPPCRGVGRVPPADLERGVLGREGTWSLKRGI